MNRRFQDFDEMLQNMHPWDVDLLRLESGDFRGNLFQVGTEGVLIGRAGFNRGTWQRGSSPEGYRTFAFLTDPVLHMIWRKQEIVMNSVMVFPPGGELEAVANKGAFRVYTLSFSEEILAEVCRSLALPDLKELLGDEEVVKSDSSMMRQLVDCLHRFCREYNNSGPERRSTTLHKSMVEDIPRIFLKVLASSKPNDFPDSVKKRDRALMILENTRARIPHEIPSIRELCRNAEVSERTLEYACHDRFGMTPRSFLKTIRLNGVRMELMGSSRRSTKIADVADRWGFRQQGGFAADYRKQFGELPSETLKRKH